LLSGAVLDASLWAGTSSDPEETLERARQTLLTLLDGLSLEPQ